MPAADRRNTIQAMTRMNADERLEQAPYKENSASGSDKHRPIHTLPEGNAKSAMEEYFSLVSACLRQIQPQDVRKSHQGDECAAEDEFIFGTPRGKSGPLIPNLALRPWRDHGYAPQKLSEPSSSSIFTNLHFSCKKARRRLPQAIWRHLRHFCIRHACELRSSPPGSGAIRKLTQNRATRMMIALSMRRRLLADHIENISLRGRPAIAFICQAFGKSTRSAHAAGLSVAATATRLRRYRRHLPSSFWPFWQRWHGGQRPNGNGCPPCRYPTATRDGTD